MQHSPARQLFRAQLQAPEEELNLAQAALYLAWEDQGLGDPEAALDELDRLANEIRLLVNAQSNLDDQVRVLNRYLFEDIGFRGNTWNYSDPANSFLDRVLQTRNGLPITLSLVYIEVGQRLGLPVAGLALPGHFLVQIRTTPQPLFLDPFNRGRFWSLQECERQITAAYGARSAEFIAEVMAPPSKRLILTRMLRNLKNTYIETNNWTQALAAIERILLIEPENLRERRDRGMMYLHLNQLHLAIHDLDAFAASEPRSQEVMVLREQFFSVAARLALHN